MFPEIKSIIVTAYDHYLQEVLSKNLPEKHEELRWMFDAHMGNIAKYCMDGYMNAPELTEVFIKWLHKSFYPPGYKIDTIIGWKKVHMIPGKYKIYDNGIDSLLEPGMVNAFAPSRDTKKAVRELIQNFNENIKKQLTMQEKKDLFLWFVLDFSLIHPFGDWNGRLTVILLDLMLAKYGMVPMNLHAIKEKSYFEWLAAVEKTMKTRDLKYMYEIIKKYSE
ncbi:MAG: hypothetical protein ACD_71C00124G0006 [uncultured bacterium (gcode 4)]|uniref:Fido domain-containing protein n=1 Tax=uncultured bacterium (gcode 4) TaxID=1234023 RepID=K2A379_9BACT|nr:MAG: hypothetical protein ACD_71C00124G0006 [uncultured bacterium (gcode 4)]